jgi:hypothetical protein
LRRAGIEGDCRYWTVVACETDCCRSALYSANGQVGVAASEAGDEVMAMCCLVKAVWSNGEVLTSRAKSKEVEGDFDHVTFNKNGSRNGVIKPF